MPAAAAFAVALIIIVVLVQIAQNQAMPAAAGTRIAVAQLTSKAVKWDNLIQVARCAGWARRASCRMLFLPECFGFLGSSAAETLAAAEDPSFTRTNGATLNQLLTGLVLRGTADDEDEAAAAASTAAALADGSKIDAPLVTLANQQVSLVDGLRTVAKASGMWISAGGVHVLATGTTSTTTANQEDDDDKNKKVYNTHLILDGTGEIRASYSKIHLFDVCIPAENVDLRESRTTAPGSSLVVCPDTPIGCLGLSVCYDLRFPEMYVSLVEMGATTILVPSAFTVPTGTAHWHTLLRARAIETQCYVIAAAQYGRHNEKRESYGHSLVVDPWGTVVADAGGVDSSSGGVPVPTTPSIVTCEVNSGRIDEIRQRMPIQEHRKSASSGMAVPK